MGSYLTTADGSKNTPQTEPQTAYYISNVLRFFAERLARRKETQVLDVGPICGANINFLAERVKKLFVCDMFSRLDKDRRQGVPCSQILRHLDYPPRSFDGILLWELADRLEDREAEKLMERCRTFVKADGGVILFMMGQQPATTLVNSFVIGDDFRLYMRPQPHLDLPLQGRQNRDVLAMMAPFKPVKSFIYRNGLREFLFQHA